MGDSCCIFNSQTKLFHRVNLILDVIYNPLTHYISLLDAIAVLSIANCKMSHKLASRAKTKGIMHFGITGKKFFKYFNQFDFNNMVIFQAKGVQEQKTPTTLSPPLSTRFKLYNKSW